MCVKVCVCVVWGADTTHTHTNTRTPPLVPTLPSMFGLHCSELDSQHARQEVRPPTCGWMTRLPRAAQHISPCHRHLMQQHSKRLIDVVEGKEYVCVFHFNSNTVSILILNFDKGTRVLDAFHKGRVSDSTLGGFFCSYVNDDWSDPAVNSCFSLQRGSKVSPFSLTSRFVQLEFDLFETLTVSRLFRGKDLIHSLV